MTSEEIIKENAAFRSQAEREIFELIKLLLPGSEIQRNDRTIVFDPITHRHKELDFFIPSAKKAIEFNGTYWHWRHQKIWEARQKFTTLSYEAFKKKPCEREGIELLQIEEQSWKHSKDDEIARIAIFLLNTNDILKKQRDEDLCPYLKALNI